MPLGQPDWVRDAVFYQIFPDRFARSDKVPKPRHLESWDARPTLFGFKGGDLLGVVERLDYLQDLGVNALYLNPIFASTANHRYHTHDYFKVDPLLGGDPALKQLLAEAHRRGLAVILDGVFNHASRGFYQFSHTLENGVHSPYLDWFHFNRAWLESGRPLDAYAVTPLREDRPEHEASLERYGFRAWWDIPALPKFNTDNPEVRAFLLDVAAYWIRFGADGWRLDVPAEIDDDAFWQAFRERVRAENPRAYIVGEIWDHPARWLEGKLFDGVTSYLFSEAVLGFVLGETLDSELLSHCGLRHTRPLGVSEFAQKLEGLWGLKPDGVAFGQLNLLGSHDTPRLLSVARGDHEKVKLAYTCLFGFPGAPCVYYGDEIGMPGRHDPDCRRAFEWDEKLWAHGIRSHVQALARARKQSAALRRGDFRVMRAERGAVAWRRTYAGEEVFVAVNPTATAFETTLACASASHQAQFRNVLDGGRAPARTENGELKITVPAGASQVWVKEG